MLGAILALHVDGADRRQAILGPFSELLIQLGVMAVLVVGFNMRAAYLALIPLGLGLAVGIRTVFCVTAITNAFNFLDNMDGPTTLRGSFLHHAFLITALSIHQWFVAATLACCWGL